MISAGLVDRESLGSGLDRAGSPPFFGGGGGRAGPGAYGGCTARLARGILLREQGEVAAWAGAAITRIRARYRLKWPSVAILPWGTVCSLSKINPRSQRRAAPIRPRPRPVFCSVVFVSPRSGVCWIELVLYILFSVGWRLSWSPCFLPNCLCLGSP